jgi:hypothetical protein
MGGYLMPKEGELGGESRGEDLIPIPISLSRSSRATPRDDCGDPLPLSLDQTYSYGGTESTEATDDSANSLRAYLRPQWDTDGRVKLDNTPQSAVRGAKCLVCRAGVQCWLRVYTG